MGVVALLTASAAFAEFTPYASISGGLAFLNDVDTRGVGILNGEASFDTGYTIEGAFGFIFPDQPFRLEGALGYQVNDVDKYKTGLGNFSGSGDDLSFLTVMGNFYYDFHMDSPLIPFLMAGLGIANVDGDDTVVAVNLGGGVGYALDENVTLDLKYKYFVADDAELDDVDIEDISAHQILFGVRFTF